jgi:hypothetical protein
MNIVLAHREIGFGIVPPTFAYWIALYHSIVLSEAAENQVAHMGVKFVAVP